MVGVTLGTEMCPDNCWQYYSSCYTFCPGGEELFTVGLAAVVWATRNARNKVTFEGTLVNTPFEIVFSTCTFFMSWTGIQKEGNKDVLKTGAELLRTNGINHMWICDAVKGGCSAA